MGDKDKPNDHIAVEQDAVEFSNSVRLTGVQWLCVGVCAVLVVALAPWVWEVNEPFHPGPDYRIPHDLGNDYWLYKRNVKNAVEHCDTVLLGDSVIWGEYVTEQQTLSHYLNKEENRYANLGQDGAHPLALEGLIEAYASPVQNMKVLVQCNPLWLSSAKADLQDDKATEFNHPRLVPQFSPPIPAYKEEISTRLGVVVEQHSPFSQWTNHLQQAYYERSDIPGWTLDHPYENPLRPLTRGLPPTDNSLRHLPQPWFKSGITEQDYPWVDLNTSLQWQAFQRVVQRLRQRGNRVFVLVGPFNEHLLSPASKERYQQVKVTITGWLESQQVPYLAPLPLASELYGDASHPLAAGYEKLARQLLVEPSFQKFQGSE